MRIKIRITTAKTCSEILSIFSVLIPSDAHLNTVGAQIVVKIPDNTPAAIAMLVAIE
ncbi:hypothetical protein D3C86_2044430 [compost metagenome]